MSSQQSGAFQLKHSRGGRIAALAALALGAAAPAAAQPSAISSTNNANATLGPYGSGAIFSGSSGLVTDQRGTGAFSSTITVGAGSSVLGNGGDATDPYNGQGIFAGNQGTGITSITTGTGTTVQGSGNGVVLVNANANNASAASITLGGSVTGSNTASAVPSAYDGAFSNPAGGSVGVPPIGFGVLAVNRGSGTLTITTSGGVITAAQDRNAIDARNSGGLLTIDNSDSLQHSAGSTGGSGINAINSDGAGVDVANSGSIGTVGGTFGNGIVAFTTSGTGDVSILNSGQIGTAATPISSNGIQAFTGGSGDSTGNVSVTSNAAVFGSNAGIVAFTTFVNSSGVTGGTGTITVGGSGPATGGSGIIAYQQGSRTGTGNTGTAVTVTGTGAATGSTGAGIDARVTNGSNAGSILVNRSGTVSGATTGISAGTAGIGAVTVTTGAGAVTGNASGGNAASSTGITATSDNTTINAGTVQVSTGTGAVTGRSGIIATTAGRGTGSTVTVNVGGNVSGSGGNGVAATSVVGTVTVNQTAGTIQATGNGIQARATSSGAIVVNQSGGQIGTATTAVGGDAINATRNTAGIITVTGRTIFATSYGVLAQNTSGGAGNVSVDARGSITSASGGAIAATTNGSGNVVVSTAAGTTLSAGGSGTTTILAQHSGTGAGYVSVTNAGTLTRPNGVSGDVAINALNQGGSAGALLNGVLTAISVTNTGTITDNFTSGGIFARAGSAGAVLVNNSGNVTTGGVGILASNTGSGAVTVNQTGGTIQSSGNGIEASTSGAGTLSVNQSGGQIGTSITQRAGGVGIQANRSAAGNILVTAGTIFAGTNGVNAQISGNVAGSVQVTSGGTINALSTGINATTTGSGTVTVASGAVTTTNGSGIVGTGTSGAVSVTAAGNVTAGGAGNAGVYSTSTSTEGSVTVGSVGAGTQPSVAGAIGLRVSGGANGTGVFALANYGTIASTATGGNAIQIDSGTLVVGAQAGTLTGRIAITAAGNTGSRLNIDRANDLTLANIITGAGVLNKAGTAKLTLSGGNAGTAAFTGMTNVNGGTLLVDSVFGDTDATGGLNQAVVNVNDGGTIGGNGTIAGTVTINDGGRLSSGSSPGTLTVNGNVTLSTGSAALFELGAANSAGSPDNDLVVVGGNLALNGGTLALQDLSGGQVASGFYTLFDVAGTTTGRFGTVLNGGVAATAADVRQIVTNGGLAGSQYQVLLANGGQVVQFWDGQGAANDGAILGGSGIWNAGNANWTTVAGGFNSTWQSAVGVFDGAAGVVTVSGTQGFEGLQFKTSGYTLSGSALALSGNPFAGSNGRSYVSVDNGVATTITSVLTDSGGLSKQGAGTLVLSGRNTYSGGTEIAGGVLSISTNRNLGTASSGLIFSGGQLQATGIVSMSRSVSLVADGVIGITGTNGPLPNSVDLSGPVSGAGGIDFLGGGTLALLGTNTYAGNTTVRGGSLFGNTDAIRGNLANAGLAVFRQTNDGTFAGNITGWNGTAGTMLKRGVGTLTLGGTSSLDWTADEGTLVSSADRFTGNVSISAGAGFVFDQAEAGTYTGTLSTTPPDAFTDPNAARAAFTVTGGGTVMLSGDSSGFTGTSTIAGGSGLVVAGALGGDVSVLGGTLSGTGRIGGDLSVGAAGRLSARSGETLTVGGDLALASSSSVDAALGGVSSTALFDIGGDLVLDGTLNVSNAGGFGAGVYRLFSYRGSLTDNGLGVGTVPSGVDAADLTVQTAIGGRVNLVSSGGADLAFWDGGNAILHDNGQVDGGAGTWRADGRNWTSLSGVANGPFRPNPTFAVFQGTGGAVTVDRSAGAIGVTGMQFASDGYMVSGDPIALQGPNGESVIRVGDGSTAGASVTATIAATLTGNTSLVKDDRGTLVLSGTNAYTGGTQVRAGTLVGNAGSIRSGLANAGTVVFNEGGDAAFAGNIAGLDGTAGRMIKRGAGTLTLAGTSLLDWSVEAGQLVSSTSRFTGDLALVSGAGFTFNQTEAGIYAGTLSGRGTLGFAGGGSVQLTGDSSAYAGLASVRDATLSVNGRLGGSANIGAGGVLKGTGTIGSGAGSVVTVASGGTLSPGNSPGTLNVNGDLVLASGSRYEVEVVPGTATSDRVVAAGTATLGGGTVAHVGLTGAYDPTATWTILSAAGGVSGTFGAVSSDFAFLDAALGYTANDVTLTLSRNDVEFVQVGQTRNQRATAGALDDLRFGNALYDTIVGLDAPTARSAFDQLSGEVHASVQAGLVEDSRFLRDAVSNRIEAAFEEARINDATTNHGMTQTNSDAAPLAGSDITAWLSAYGTFGEARGNGNAASLERSSGGFFVGADAPVGNDSRLGLVAGYGYTDFDLDARQSYAHANTGSLGLYGSTALNAWEFDAGSAVSFTSLDTGRGVSFGTFSDSLSGETQAITAQVFGEVGYRFPFEQGGLHGSLKPFLGLAYVNQHTDGFGEEGGLASLSVESQSMDTTFTTLGLRAATSVPLGSTTLSLDAMAGWRHAFGDIVPTATASFAGSSAFTVEGTPLSEDAAVLELGVGFALAPNAAFSLDYAGQFGSRSTDNGVKASLNVSF